jgi:signal transduction histidine kinase
LNIYAIPPVIAASAYFLLAVFVYSKQKQDPINRSFAIMLLCVSIWNVDVAGIRAAPNPEFADLWGNIFRNGLFFIPPTFMHFTLLFTNPHGFSGGKKKTLLSFYGASCFFALLNWHPKFTGEVVRGPWGYSIKSGPLYVYYVMEFIICILISFFYLLRGFVETNSYHRQKIKYFLLAIGVGFVLGGTSFLHMFGVGVYPLVGTFGVLAAALVMSYTIVQHRLMDVSIFLSKGLGYIFSLGVLGIPAALALFFLERYFFNEPNSYFSVFVILIGVTVALVLNTLKDRIDGAMHQIIVRDKYKYHEVLDEFSRRLVTIVDLARLLWMLAETIEKSMGVKDISIFLQEAEREGFRTALIRGSENVGMLKLSEPCVHSLHSRKDAILRTELSLFPSLPGGEELAQMMKQFKAEVCLPLIYMNRLIGFINLGHKAKEEMYYTEDLNLLSALASQVAIAIENANLYENLKRSQNIMRRADRLASLGTLIASLAHEIRNPLVSIKTFTQLLPERIDDAEFRDYFLKVASGEIDRLTGLINELLGFARPSELRPQGEDINGLIEKMGVLVSTEARKKNIALTKNYMADLPQIKVDPEQIKQVLLNILLNAIQATNGEGKIWIETRVVQVSIEEKNESFIQVEIRDTGMGIPKENLERIFDPFFSTRPEGSGLGLAISHQIIHEHGGFIQVDSEVGKGTSFKVHLPLKPGGKLAAQN